jgi:hypothetical protein
MLELTKDSKHNTIEYFRTLLIKLLPILEKTESSEFMIRELDEEETKVYNEITKEEEIFVKNTFILHRMYKKPFESLYYNMQTTKA